jgi:hypothetical protein
LFVCKYFWTVQPKLKILLESQMLTISICTETSLQLMNKNVKAIWAPCGTGQLQVQQRMDPTCCYPKALVKHIVVCNKSALVEINNKRWEYGFNYM